jgi:hypothetical protein
MKKHKIQVTVEVTEERMKDLLCNAMEGGSAYWAKIDKYIIPDNADTSTVEFKHIDIPFIDGCGIMIKDQFGDDEPKLLNMESMLKSLKIMGEKYNWHLEAFVHENDDAETGDVFLQCALYDKIIYG